MGQDLRIEDPEVIFFIGTRTMNSRLWFVNNDDLHRAIYAFLAKYQELYGVIIYGFVLMGNHYHLVAQFPRSNMAAFMQAFNAIIAKLVQTHVPQFPGGKLWGKRYSAKALPRNQDVQHWWLYTVLNPVSTGLVKFPDQYRTCNSFEDSVTGRERSFRLFLSSEYNEAERRGHNPDKEAYFRMYTLKYTRLPGYEPLPAEEYERTMRTLREARRLEYIEALEQDKYRFPPPEVLRLTKPGAVPRKTKTSTWDSYRALVLTLCSETRKRCVDEYFNIRKQFLEASARFLAGELAVIFPYGTYRPRASVAVMLTATQ